MLDKELRQQVLRAAIADRTFLKAAYHDIVPSYFPSEEEQVIAEVAVKFYENYGEPIGAMLRVESNDLAQQKKFGSDKKEKLKLLQDSLLAKKIELVSVKALQDRLTKLKRKSFYEQAVEDIISAHEQGKLTAYTLTDLVEKANKELNSNGLVSHDYFNEVDARITQRSIAEKIHKYPKLLIDPIDKRIKLIGRGHLGMALAPPGGGKGLFLCWIDRAYAMQGLNVLHITLEDPIEEVEKRLDACLAGMPLSRLNLLPVKFKRRWKKMSQGMRGKIRIIDGTNSGWTVSQIQKAWDHERQNGFIADAIVIDYDDEIECEKQFKGESARRFEFAEVYRRLRKLAADTNTIVWTAGQTSKAGETKKIITGKDTAEDYSKIRKVFFAVGIGRDPHDTDKNLRYLNIIKNRLDRAHFYVTVMSKYNKALFYDRQATLEWQDEQKNKPRER